MFEQMYDQIYLISANKNEFTLFHYDTIYRIVISEEENRDKGVKGAGALNHFYKEGFIFGH